MEKVAVPTVQEVGMIDLVIIRHEGTDTSPYLFQAPAFSGLKENDLVEVETCKGTARGKVLGACTVAEESSEYKCFSLMAKMKPFKRVIRMFRAYEIKYPEEVVKNEK